MPRKYNKFSSDFRDDAVRLVIDASRPVAQVARELDINEGTLGNWVNLYRKAHAGEEPPLSVSERLQFAETQRELRDLRMENEFLKKSRSVLRPGSPVTDKFECIDSCRDLHGKYAYPVRRMCTWLSVSASWYFQWLKAPMSATAARREVLAAEISVIFTESDQTYGYRRVHAELGRRGIPAGPELVRAIMRDLGLITCQPRPWRVGLTEDDGRDHDIPDRLKQDFTATEPGTKLVGDITYVPTWEGWMFLATVIDCATKMVIGYAMGDNYKTPLISAALRNAAANQKLQPGAIFHSDRGSNYTSYEFARTVADLDMRQSMGRTGTCYDNAMAESFFAAYKNERANRTVYDTRAHAMIDGADYLNFYNQRRLHSGLGYKTPQEALNEWTNTQEIA